MMAKKFRLIPSVLFQNGSVVKSINFKNHRIVGDLPSTMRVYSKRQADELVICDLDAANSKSINWSMVRTCVENSNMPLTYAGGVKSPETAEELLLRGFDKICVNTIVHENSEIVFEIAKRIGSSSLMASIDIFRDGSHYYVCSNRGSRIIRKFNYHKEIRFLDDIGVGEVLINCIHRDGLLTGYDFQGLNSVSDTSNMPVLISGGCSGASCIKQAYEKGFDGAVMSSVFLWKGDSIPSLKQELRDIVPVREVVR